MVTYDYLQVMKAVRVAELKSHLSEHLRSCGAGTLGRVDRDTPIAQIVPCRWYAQPSHPPAPAAVTQAQGLPRPGATQVAP